MNLILLFKPSCSRWRSFLPLVLLLVICNAALCSVSARSQTLARPGWVGSGMSIERWWRHALMVDVHVGPLQANTGSDGGPIGHVIAHLDDLKALGIDAIVLRDLPEMHAESTTSDAAFNAWLERFDTLVQQASGRSMRVLVEVVPSTQVDLTAKTRFWLSRGVAGFYLGTAEADGSGGTGSLGQSAALTEIRSVVREYAGDRLVIAPEPPEVTAASALAAANPAVRGSRGRSRGDPFNRPSLAARSGNSGNAEMLLVRIAPPLPGTRANVLRTSLDRAVQRIYASSVTPLLSVGSGAASDVVSVPSKGRVEATMLLGFGAQALLEESDLSYPEETASESGVVASNRLGTHGAASTSRAKSHLSPMDAAESHTLYEWYRRLDALVRANPTLKSGATTLLDRDQDNALVWVRTPPGGGPSIVIACNLSSSPTTFSIVENLQQLHLRGSFLRTLLRSDQGMGAMPLGAVHLLPHAVYIGELRR